MDSLQGHLLIASPHLPDPNFYRAVVLMIEHQQEGALGLILNRIGNLTLADAWDEPETPLADPEKLIRVGGPVEGPLMALHGHEGLGGHLPLPGLFFAGDRDIIGRLVQQTEHVYHLFMGYAGWGPGQLEGELEIGGWLTMPAKPAHVFQWDVETLWEEVVHLIGDEITSEALGIRRRPIDPSAN